MADLSIKIKIADREYPLRAASEEEERLRRAGKLLNEKLKFFKQKFGIENTQDLFAMVAFDLHVELLKKSEIEPTSAVSEQTMNKVSELNLLLDKMLN